MTPLKTHVRRGLVLSAALVTLGAGNLHAQETDHARIELGVFAGLHTFSTNNELGNFEEGDTNLTGVTTPKNFIAFGLRIGALINQYIAIEAEAGMIPTKTREIEDFFPESVSARVMFFRGHLLFHFLTGKLRPFALVGGGLMMVSSDDEEVLYNDKDDALHAGLGVKYDISKSVILRLDARLVAPPSTESSGLTLEGEVLAGISFGLGSLGKSAPPPPPPPQDSDGDGIMDPDDKCPEEAEDSDGFEDEDGCPDPDNDGDGIPDADDKCRDQAETKNGVDDEDGCPEEDPDGDGKFGSADQCPNEAEDADGFQDDDGCPDPDNDGDGVLDANDKCPTEPETPNNYEDADGCPDTVPEKVQKFTGTIKGINFRTGSAVILRSSYKVLDQAVAVLKEFPSVRLEIQGHTDDRGNDDFNLSLSQKRSESVRAYFVGKGIEEDRLKAVGYGEQMPKDPRKTRAARAQNRRVDFVLINQ